MTLATHRVLVTGAAGYVGRLAVAALAARDDVDRVIALDVSAPNSAAGPNTAGPNTAGPNTATPTASLAHAKVDVRTGSVCDATLADLVRDERVNVVLHLASVVRAPPGAPPDLAYRVDVLGTQNVLRACLAHGVKKLVVTSSGAAYGYHADNPTPLVESDAVRGNAEFAYAYHKRLIEEMLARARTDHPELAQLVFRPGTVLGETVRSPVTDLFERSVMLGVAGYPSPFVFIWDSDVVDCLVRGVVGPEVGVYNLAGDGAMSPREIAQVLRKPYVPVPAAVLRLALRALRRVGLTEHGPERVSFLQYRPVLDNTRLKRDFGFVPTLTSRQAFERYARARFGA